MASATTTTTSTPALETLDFMPALSSSLSYQLLPVREHSLALRSQFVPLDTAEIRVYTEVGGAVMLCSRLVRLIAENWDPLSAKVFKDIRSDARLRSVGGLPESDLRERARDILEHLDHWLMSSREHELARHFEHIGGQRQEERIPLDEVVLAYLKIK